MVVTIDISGGMMLRKIEGRSLTYEYQYDGRAPFKDVSAWCRENLGLKHRTNGHETIWISGKEAAALFLLRWA